MLGRINKTLTKQVDHLKYSLAQKTQFSSQEMKQMLAQMEKNLQESFKTTLEASDKKLTETKNQLKKKNKMHNEFKLATSKRQIQMARETDLLRRQSDKNQKKIRQLLKVSHKYEKVQEERQQIEEKHTQTKGTQCELKDLEMQKILEDLKQQNIFLTEKISELQQKINQNEQNIDAANILIKELINQLDTNSADRQTWNDTTQSQVSEKVSLRLEKQSDECEESSDIQRQMSQQSADCGREASDQDNSTIDQSNTTHRDYALPEWLEFNQPVRTPGAHSINHLQQEHKQMWPQLIWSRLLNFLGLNQKH